MKLLFYHFRLRMARVQNAICLFMVFVTSLCMAPFSQAQDYYHYYNGEKHFLKLNTQYVYVVSDAPVSAAQMSLGLKAELEITEFNQDNAAQTVKALDVAAKSTSYWTVLKIPERLSQLEYQGYLNDLRSSGLVSMASPYFSAESDEKIGLSHYFHVKLKREDDLALLRQWVQDSGTEIVGQDKFMPRWYMLRCTKKSKFNALDYANMFYESGLFEYAEPEFIIDDVSLTPNDPLYPNQWGLNNTGLYGGTAGIDVNALQAWDITKGSRDVVVAVLDQGFEMDHPDLAGNTFGTGFNTVTATSPSVVFDSHGTACAGIIGAIQDNNQGLSGVAPNAQLMSISNPLVGNINTLKSQLAAGLNWAWQNGAHVISNSWGHNLLVSNLIDDAIDNALNNGRNGLGTIVVFSAGNDNNNVIYPASSDPDIISVGAMSPCGERKSFTSCDGETWGSCFGTDLDVMAPGVLVSTTDRQGVADYNPNVPIHTSLGGSQVLSDFADDDYTIWFNGTSAAAPMVAGVAALVLSVNPCLTHDQVEDIIEQSAQKVGGYGYAMTMGRPNGTWHNEMGYGLVDAEAAVLMAQSMLPNDMAFDIYSKDRPFDTGVEPNPDGGPMWISEDIWVRQTLDGGLTHQNPEYKQFSPNGLYVKVTNRGTTMSDCANLSVYFSKASSGLVWPIHWENYNLAGVLHGDKINTVSIPPIAPGASEIIEVPWYPPNPADFTNDSHHFCLLARIESPADPMFNEQIGIGVSTNVRQNNNIAWKNVSVYDNIADFVSIFIRPNLRGWSRININFFDRGFNEKIEKAFFDRDGEIFIKVDPELFERLQKAELEDVKIIEDNLLYIASPRAGIYGLEMNDEETFSMHLAFNVDVNDKEQVLLDVVQTNEETKEFMGGERFVITQVGDGHNDKLKAVLDGTSVFPNPAEDEIFITYEVGVKNAQVQVTVYNVLDPAQSTELFTGSKSKGEHTGKFSVRHLKKGIYVLNIKIGDKVTSERIVIK